jgi:glutamate transport system substrate-binding protein
LTEDTGLTENDSVQAPPRKRLFRQWGRATRLSALLIALALVVGAGLFFWWQQVPSENDLKVQAGLTGKAQLLVGVLDDIPGIGYQDLKSGVYSGFDIDIAYLVAGGLGFRPEQVRFLTVRNEDRGRMSVKDGQSFSTADLVVAAFSIDRPPDEHVNFSAPYLQTEQSVLTLKGHEPVEDLRDLAGKQVCTLTTSTSSTPAETAGALVTGKKAKISDCVRDLRDGKYDAVTTDAAILAGFAHAEPNIFEHHNVGLVANERYGINTGDNAALRQLVNLALYRSRNDPKDTRWEQAYEHDLNSEQPESRQQPVASNKQPTVDEVRIRQWPWERLEGIIHAPMTADRRRRRAASSGR